MPPATILLTTVGFTSVTRFECSFWISFPVLSLPSPLTFYLCHLTSADWGLCSAKGCLSHVQLTYLCWRSVSAFVFWVLFLGLSLIPTVQYVFHKPGLHNTTLSKVSSDASKQCLSCIYSIWSIRLSTHLQIQNTEYIVLILFHPPLYKFIYPLTNVHKNLCK